MGDHRKTARIVASVLAGGVLLVGVGYWGEQAYAAWVERREILGYRVTPVPSPAGGSRVVAIIRVAAGTREPVVVREEPTRTARALGTLASGHDYGAIERSRDGGWWRLRIPLRGGASVEGWVDARGVTPIR